MPLLTFSQEDNQLSYYQSGQGTPVVFLHGFPLDHRMWSPQISALSGSCHVIAPDLRGFGSSTLGQDDVTHGVEMSRYAADVQSILDRASINEPIILCGFSMGGYVLWQCLRQFRDRIGAIVLCDTKATADSTEAAANRIKMADQVLADGTEPVAKAMLPKLLAPSTFETQPEIAREVDAMIRRCDPSAIAAAQRGMALRPDVSAELGGIDCPALVLVGAEDQISTPAEMESIADALPQADFVKVPKAGHMTTLENPQAVSDALLRFVSELTG